ncbi:lytic polysaccharide monooxygenase auxiliary activity family 9 protein [Dactylosporangium salmoneum]|uniref:CBM2 domain-containing protein n=1 Tax=Dactylosporangium salmoneum TaxID=53361 RepID=A0ABP5TZ18_9ACTN
MNRRRRLALMLAAALAGAGAAAVVAAQPAAAHGAMMQPGSRTYLCWKDGLTATGQIVPQNPACAAAVAQSGPNALYNWFAELRSDGAGRTAGFIPDGKLCSAAATVYDFSGFDLARNDWPVTHLTSGASMEFDYSNWAAHPGTFSLYVTKDGFDPTRPMAWSDLESTPFLQVTNPSMVGSPGTTDGHYYWTGKLPTAKSGRHVIYSVWARSDSQETFYGCSDVMFDGGHGEVTGMGNAPTPPSSPSTSTSPSTSSSPRTSSSPSNPGGGGGACTATYTVTSSWQGGFQADVKVSNPGSAPITGWTAGWNYTGGQTVTQGWNATITQSGTAVTAKNVDWNGTVPAGGSTNFGLLGSGSPGTAPTLSCTAAGGTTTPPSSPPSSPPVSPSGSTSPPPPAGCAGAAFCDGFESQSGSTVSGVWGLSYRDCQGTGTATVDTAVAHSGGKSVRIDGKAGYCNHVLVKPTKDLSGLGSVWYARFYVRHSTALPAAHVAFAALRDNADGGKDLRMGGQNGALQWNRESDDATLPAQSPAGVAQSRPLPTGSWNCVEFMVNGSGTLQTWLNGTAVPGLTVDGTPTPDIDQQWLGRTWRPQVTDLRLGWESYGVGDDTLWFDDVAIGVSRVGC